MQRVTIDTTTCDRLPACQAMRACPRGAIRPVEGGVYPGSNGYAIDETRCTGCAVCVLRCPSGAIRLA
ncbi:MAG: 4Fe-4S binding protein [Coriobacteriia bacterium]|nr:4Fe-4S binding protein [Coriobacteriia bacterium]